MRELAEKEPGSLYRQAREALTKTAAAHGKGDPNATSRPFSSYLAAHLLARFPLQSIEPARLDQLRTVATTLDHVAEGRLAQSADVLTQEFKALEQELLKNPVAALHCRLVEAVPGSLMPRAELQAANRYEVAQHRFRQARAREVGRT